MAALIEKGKIFVKTAGRHAGEKVTIIEAKEGSFVLVKRKNGKEERCNLRHLMPVK